MKGGFIKIPRLIIFAGIIVLVILVYRYFAPFGKEVKYSFVKTLPGSEEINVITGVQGQPIHLVSQLIKNKISRLSIKINPKTISNINLHFKFKPGQKEIKVGVRGDEKQSFNYQSLYYSLFDNISWSKLTDGNLVLFQKNPQYQSLATFLQNPPTTQKIALYQVNSNIINQATPDAKVGKFSLPVPLRNNHSFLISVGTTQPLQIKIGKKDLNMYAGADKLKAQLYLGDQLVTEKTIADDGVVDKSQKKTNNQEVELKVAKPQPGVYRLELITDSAGSDLQITRLDINQPKVMISKNFFPVDSKALTFYSTATKITALTYHQDSFQTLKINNKFDVKIDKVNQKKTIDLAKIDTSKPKVYKIDSPKSDLVITSDGYFAFSADAIFSPQTIKTINFSTFADFDDAAKNVDYILTNVPTANNQDGWLDVSVDINPNKIKFTGDTLYLSLEIPDLDKNGGSLEINAFDVIVRDGQTLITPTITSIPSIKPSITPAAIPTATVKKPQSTFNLFTSLKNTFKKIFTLKPSFHLPSITPTLTPIPTPSGSCKLNEQVLSVGATFAAADGCNVCTCTSNLQIECTSNTCSQK